MKLLSDILYKAGIDEIKGTTKLAITSICFDSRAVEQSSLFVAVKGTKVDGHVYIEKAIADGAIAIVCEQFPEVMNDKITYVQVKDSSFSLGIIAANFFDNPSEKLKLVGITGTNGKTTTATLLYNLFKSTGHKVGLLSTVKNQINNEKLISTHTTGDAIQINALLSEMVKKGCTHCFMEVSSHGIHQQRTEGLHFEGGVFTNLSHDHLDYHPTFAEYRDVKKSFFDHLPKTAFALVNVDDKNGDVMLQNTAARKLKYALKYNHIIINYNRIISKHIIRRTNK